MSRDLLYNTVKKHLFSIKEIVFVDESIDIF